MAMAAPPKPSPIPPSTAEAVQEIMHLYRSLPPRPSLDELEAAMAILNTSAAEEVSKLEEIKRIQKPHDLPDELFFGLQEARRSSVLLHGAEQRREAQWVVDLDRRMKVFDEILQRASRLVSSSEMDAEVVGKETREGLGLVASSKPEATPAQSMISSQFQ